MEVENQQEAVEGEELETEHPAGDSESATEENEGSQEQGKTEGGEGVKPTLSPKAQEAVNRAINRQHAKYREQQERADALQEQLDRLQGSQQEQRPVVPPVPDPLDDDFDQKMQERDDAIKRQWQYDAQQQQRQQQEQQRQRGQLEEAQKAFVAKAVSYKQRADAMQIDPQALQMAGAMVSNYGLSDVITDHILGHDKGPLITQHLAANLNDLEKLGGMDPISAGLFIATSIVPKLSAGKTKTSAPPPPETVDGSAAPPTKRGPPGATYY